MTTTQEKIKPMKIVVIGAGVAGLAVAYGLSRPEHASRFEVRIFEKRTEDQCLEAGYPIHLSPSGRGAVESLFTPEDLALLRLARQTLPARHDGITFHNSESKRIWHTLREPFESSLVERGDLLRILRNQVQGVEFDRRVVSVKEQDKGAVVMMSNGEVISADLLIGADGMYSPVRKSLHPLDDFSPMPWVTCNFRLSQAFVEEGLGADPLGISVFYGTGWSAAVLPLPKGAYVALTVPAPVTDISSALARLPDVPLIQAIRSDPGIHDANAFPLYSAVTTQIGRGQVVLIGDAAHGMNPFCGAGASMALDDAANLVELLTGDENLDEGLPRFNRNLKKTTDPMIKMSKTLLWLAQGKTPMDRFIRGLAFRIIELAEKVLPMRRSMRNRLNKVLAEPKDLSLADTA